MVKNIDKAWLLQASEAILNIMDHIRGHKLECPSNQYFWELAICVKSLSEKELN